MRQPATLPNTGTRFEAHTLNIPPECPVSQNPRPGSTVTICYRPKQWVLEIGSLFAYIHQFKGGLKDDQGNLVVRNMEDMIQRIADDCAQALGVSVGVTANLMLVPHQGMFLMVRGKPVISSLSASLI